MDQEIDQKERTGSEIAVVGMAARFPGAKHIHQFWENLKNGVESISFLGDEELEKLRVDPELSSHQEYVKTIGSVLEDKDCFDASFFDYTPREAEIMDPQIRVFHECAWEALEDAGYYSKTYKKLIGLYAGATCTPYWEVLTFLSGKTDDLGEFASGHLNNKDFLSTRIAYRLNLKGPAITVHTACSTSLVAIHLACQAILNGECDMALAGGVTALPQEKCGYMFEKGMVMSRDGHCRAFDARAAGFVGGNGVGVVLLKTLEDALADRDHIYAVVLSTAINNDGLRKIGYTAPSAEGQAEAIGVALRMAEVEPGNIGYVETHGTGTELGDLVEIEALKLAFNTTNKKGFCAIGSVKTNIGHTDSAAGVASFIKTVLALKHRLIPPSLHFQTPNPGIDFENSPFYVNTELSQWKNGKYPLRAGISSFGIGGTNAHVILEEAPGTEDRRQKTEDRGQSQGRGGVSPPGQSREYQLILLSAKTQSALDRMTENLAEYFKKNLLNRGNRENPTNPGQILADAAYTLQVGRGAFQYRRMLGCSTIDQAIEALSSPDTAKVKTARAKEETAVIFMFPGLGSQYVNMGLDLYKTEPVFREEMNHCFEILKSLMEYDIKEILYPREAAGTPGHRESRQEEPPDINQFEIAQVAVFILEYALAKLLMKWGIKPHAMIGYSFGEYTAACISGVFSLENALKLIVTRGKLIEKLPGSAMLSVPLTKDELEPFLNSNYELSLAIDNGPSCIVAGANDAINAFEQEMKKNGYMCMRLQTTHALHSTMMDPILKEFEQTVAQVVLNKPRIPYIANRTGDWITVEEAATPIYWAKHLRETVRFAEGIEKLLEEKNAVFIEIGPSRDLSALVARHFDNDSNQRVINVVRHPQKNISDASFLLNRIGGAWLLGVNPDWNAFYPGERRYRIPLPTYPFESQLYKIKGDIIQLGVKRFTEIDQLRKKPDIADWFYIPSWKSIPLPINKIDEMPGQLRWLLFIDDHGLGTQLAEQLERKGQVVITVKPGAAFLKESRRQFTLDPQQQHGNDYNTLFHQLKQQDMIPDRIVHLWGITGNPREEQGIERLDEAQDFGFYSLIYIARAIGKEPLDKKVQITVITNNMHEITGDEGLCPGKATVLGPVRVIPAEYPGISCCNLDIDIDFSRLSQSGITQKKGLIHRLMEEIFTEPVEPIIALRGNYRWIRSFEPMRLEESGQKTARLRQEGVYLIIGGLGFIGLTLAEYLVKNVNAKLVLTGRTTLPPESQWEQYLVKSPGSDPLGQKIRKVQELRKWGAEVLVLSADVSHQKQMEKVISEAADRFGQINGVIHSAGELDSCLIQERTREMTQRILAAKVKGTSVLYKIFKDVKPDFLVLFSSLRSFLPAPGTVGQVATSNFFDYFANYYTHRVDFPIISIDWDGWHKQSLTADVGRITGAILPEKGTGAFRRILEDRLSQVAVSVTDLMHKIELTGNWTETEESVEKKESGETPAAGNLHQRPGLDTEYVAPGNETERVLSNIWTRVLGFENIGIHDDFFELSGDSLKAIMVISRIHKELKVEVPLTEFFQGLTIENIAEYINNNVEDSTFSAIQPAKEKDYYGLSSAQKRLYILQQLDKDSIGYNETQVVRVEGNIEKDKFEETFRKLVERHETFRTSIELINGEPVQQVNAPREIDFSLEYYAGEKFEDKGGSLFSPLEVEEIIRNFIRAFDLSKAPLMRAALIKLDENSHVLAVDRHHLVTDIVSNEIFIKDLLAIYAGKELPPLKLQYKDYSEWQQSQEVQNALKLQEEYWVKEFAGEIPVLNLPYDYPRPTVQSFEGSVVNFAITEEETRALNEMGRSKGTTLFMVLLALYSIFLSKLSRQEDIVVGTPVAGRRHADLEQIIGVLINILALRQFPSGEKTLTLFLREVRNRTLEAFENQDYPFEELVEKLTLPRDMSRNPLFDMMFTLYNTYEVCEAGQEVSGQEWQGLEIKPYSYANKTSKYDLTMVAIENKGILCFTFEYCTKLFKNETIVKFTRYFKEVISSALETPHKKISDIEIITAEEKKQVLVDFNNTATAAGYLESKIIHLLFEEQVRRTPDHTALLGPYPRAGVILNSIQITYDELNQKSNRLALLLIEKGIRPDTIVGIMMERSIEMIISIFGILKAGGAYLPIESDYPRERITYILKDSEAALLLTGKAVEKPMEECEVIDLEDGHWNHAYHAYHRDKKNLENINGLQELSYVIYTSGSTGRPKGVLIEYHSVINVLSALFNKYPFSPKDTYLLKTSYMFDVSVTELFGWFLGGGRLAILEPGGEKDPQKIVRIVEMEFVSHINFVPSMFQAFVDWLTLEGVSRINNLKYIFLAGEALSARVIKKFREINTLIQLENIYGPTEAAIYASQFSLICWDGKGRIPIGKPLANMKLYILDRYRNLLPRGVPGELVIAGHGVARGYLNQPELTAEKFIEKEKVTGAGDRWGLENKKLLRGVQGAPWHGGPIREGFVAEDVFDSSTFTCNLHLSPLEGKRPPGRRRQKIYKTGDSARWHDDGNIEFLGRIDSQVKIRGFRIELGEIETILSRHEAVKEAVVVLYNQEVNPRLVAYVVPRENHLIEDTGIRGFLAKHLPDYMVPSAFVILENLPITPSGKTDRRKLSALPPDHSLKSENFVAPRTPGEELLAGIWADALDARRVGIHDNFFELGGHSFTAMQVVSRANQAGLSLTLKQLFQHHTIAELSVLVDSSGTASSSTWLEEGMQISDGVSLTEIVPISRDGNRDGDIPLSFSQQRCRMYQLANPGITYYNVPYWFQIKGKLDINILRQSFNEIIRRHDILRTTFPEKNNTPFQVITEQQEVDIAVTDLQKLSGPERTRQLEKRIKDEMERPFDLVHGPLMRVTLVKLEREAHVVGLVMHHMIVDFYSMIILAREFNIIYEAFLSGKPCPLPCLTIQYADFASWQHRYYTREILEDRLRYWGQWLAERPPRLELPGDRPRPRVETYRGGTKRSQYSPNLIREIKKLAKQSGASFFMTIMAAFMTSLYHYSGYDDLVVAFPILNRNHQVKTVIGMFTATLLLRIDMGGNPSFRELLERVQRASILALQKQDVPFEYLVKTLRPGWDLSSKPSYRVLLNTIPYHAEPALEIPGLDITPLTENVGDDNVMRHDLSLDIAQEKIPAGTNLYAVWRYKKDLFDAETIDRLGDHFRFILEEMVKNPEQGVEDFIKDRSLEYQIKETNHESAADIS